MIEKLLRRFVSEDTEFVLKAMEQVGGNPDTDYWVRKAYGSMVEARQRANTHWVDAVVLRRVEQRLENERKRLSAAQEAQELAAKILMGDDFRDPEPEQKTTMRPISSTYVNTAQQVQIQQHLAQAQYNQLMQQAHAMQQSQSGLVGSLGGCLAEGPRGLIP